MGTQPVTTTVTSPNQGKKKYETSVSEELLAAPLPRMIKDLGLAVAEANAELAKEKSGILYTIDKAEIELKVALSLTEGKKQEISGGANISVFNVNASYSKTYDFKEEASSCIKLSLKAVPHRLEPAVSG